MPVPSVSNPPTAADFNPNARLDLEFLSKIANGTAGETAVNRDGEEVPTVRNLLAQGQAALDAGVAALAPSAIPEVEAAVAAATAAAEASGPAKFYDTKAAMDADVANIAANGIAEIFVDETRGGNRTRYRKESGVLVWKVDMTPVPAPLNALDRITEKMRAGVATKIVWDGDSIVYGYQAGTGTQVANPAPAVLQAMLRGGQQGNFGIADGRCAGEHRHDGASGEP